MTRPTHVAPRWSTGHVPSASCGCIPVEHRDLTTPARVVLVHRGGLSHRVSVAGSDGPRADTPARPTTSEAVR